MHANVLLGIEFAAREVVVERSPYQNTFVRAESLYSPIYGPKSWIGKIIVRCLLVFP